MLTHFQRFLKLESSSSILLGLAAVLALLFENTPLRSLYDQLLTTPIVFQIGALSLNKPLLLWINDGLMAVFFLLIGLEIKREILTGELSSKEQLILPCLAAFGGLVVPASIYAFINWDNPTNLVGWAIPAATDIAFALGVISLFGRRLPNALKVCLVTIAIIDDLAAIVIIAIFYTTDLSLLSLSIAGISLLFLAILNLRKVTRLAPYIFVGVIMWICVLKSGVHATLAGVATAFFIPLQTNDSGEPPLLRLEHALHPWVAFMVLPLFAFANAGVSFQGLSTKLFLQPITLGVMLGLFFGKQLGVMGMTFVGYIIGLVKLPEGVSWPQFYGMALLTGIGFTMSLFIGTLAFPGIEQQTAVRLGVLSGSLASGIIGYLVLRAFRTES